MTFRSEIPSGARNPYNYVIAVVIDIAIIDARRKFKIIGIPHPQTTRGSGFQKKANY